MRYSQGHNLPIFDDTDVADLNDYTEKLAQKLEIATGNQDERIDEQLRNMTLEDPSSAEIVDARGGYDLLRKRFEADEANISANATSITNINTKLNKKVYYHTNVANMKADNSLSAGDVVQTLGYYSADDGGQGLYQIVDDNTLVDDGGSVHDLVSGLKAKLIVENFVNVRQMGAKGDSTTDDTAKIQLAFNKYKNIFISDGTYMINAVTSLKPKSNSHIVLSENATLKAITNSVDTYDIVRFNNVSNIILEGGIIEGDRETHTGSSGEWGMGIAIRNNSENINIKDITAKNCWGDGLYINTAKNIKTQNIICDNNRRQGLSIISVDTYHSLNDSFINTNGTAPQAGIDIEPNYDTDILRNIVFENTYTENNSGFGLNIYLMPIISSSNRVEITIKNYTDKGSYKGLNITKTPTSAGFIKIIEPNLIENKVGAIFGDRCFNSDLRIDIIRPKVLDCNQNLNNSALNNVCFQLLKNSSELYADYPLGNIHIFEPYFKQKVNTNASNELIPTIYFQNLSNTVTDYENITITNPVFLSNSRIWLNSRMKDVILFDKYKQTLFEMSGSQGIANSNFHSHFNNRLLTYQSTLTINDSCPMNSKILIECNNSTLNLPVKFNSGNVYGLNNTSLSAPTVTLKRGARLEIEKIDSSTFICNINSLALMSV